MTGAQVDASALDVSRETFEQLTHFVALVEKWTPRINLVSRKSLSEIWTRHIQDSIQVVRNAPAVGNWVDLGSGGGFPGMIAAILALHEAPDRKVTLVESDLRKTVFLRTAAREIGVSCDIRNDRIENLAPMKAEILSARALADLTTLLAYADRHLAPGGLALFPKGVTWQKEVNEARRLWRFDLEATKSKTDSEAVILKIKGVQRA